MHERVVADLDLDLVKRARNHLGSEADRLKCRKLGAMLRLDDRLEASKFLFVLVCGLLQNRVLTLSSLF